MQSQVQRAPFITLIVMHGRYPSQTLELLDLGNGVLLKITSPGSGPNGTPTLGM